MRTIGAIIASALFLSSCTGTVHTAKITDANWTDLNGVIYYPPMLVKQVTQTTVALDKNGKLIADKDGNSGKKCKPVVTEKIATMPDYGNPRRVYYVAGQLESNTFGVTMDATGALTGVNSQSSPDQGKTAQALATTIGTLAAAAVAVAPLVAASPSHGKSESSDALLACTDSVEVLSYTRFRIP